MKGVNLNLNKKESNKINKSVLFQDMNNAKDFIMAFPVTMTSNTTVNNND